jgi:hypothetical protein
MQPIRGYAVKGFCICIALLLATGTASAQLYKWVDKDGKTRYGDTPPPGVKTSSIHAPQSGAAPAAPAKDAGKDGKKGAKTAPLTPAEQAEDFRKRQAEAKKESEKAAADSSAKAAQKENCERTKEYLRTLESGQRIARTNAVGERYYMSDSQVAQETAKAQEAVQKSCK